ncbi:MAG TPA: hypothetical protein VGM52_16210 [Herbaspirillum sp.]|jgi:hypothetical protein
MEKIFQPDMPLLTDRFLKTLMLFAILLHYFASGIRIGQFYSISAGNKAKTGEVLLKFKQQQRNRQRPSA